MKLIALVLVITLSGCAGALKPVGDWFDSQDACQTKSRPPNTPAPSYCGAGTGTNVFITRPNPGHYQVVVK